MELDKVLMWLMFLLQALLGASRRGGKPGRMVFAEQFNILATKRNWEALLKMWKVERESKAKRRHLLVRD